MTSSTASTAFQFPTLLLPHYYDAHAAPGTRYSLTGAITRPRQLLKGGYISFVQCGDCGNAADPVGGSVVAATTQRSRSSFRRELASLCRNEDTSSGGRSPRIDSEHEGSRRSEGLHGAPVGCSKKPRTCTSERIRGVSSGFPRNRSLCEAPFWLRLRRTVWGDHRPFGGTRKFE
jgi:hypothetical protein